MRKVVDNTGFSFIEVMVSAALMGTAVLLLALQQAKQTQNQATSNVQAQGRQALQDIASVVAGNPASYPFLVDGANTPVLYAGCFDMNRNPTTRIDNTKGFIAIFPAGGVNRNRIFEAGNYAEVCARGRGGFEVHVFYAVGDRKQLRIAVFALPRAGITVDLMTFSTSIGLDRF